MDTKMDKSLSDSNLAAQSEKSPPKLISKRNKRRREDDLDCQFNNFKEEIKSMIEGMLLSQESELKKITPTLMEIKQTNCNIENSIAYLAAQNDEFKKKIELLEEQARKDREYITLLEEKMEDIQRGSRKANIEIKNVPKNSKETKEDLINMFLCLSKNIDLKVTKYDIKDVYRVQGKKKDGKNDMPIIVETSSTILKTEILKMCKIFNIKHKQKLCAKHLGFTVKEDTPVYISEHLTAKGSRLYFVARELTKSKAFKYCWTAYGRVYIRKDENSPIIIIINEAQVHNLMQKI